MSKNIIIFLVVIAFAVSYFVAKPKTQSTPSPAPETIPTVVATDTSPTSSEKCLITVKGDQYDVTIFRTIHKGGNIFICDSDMTDTMLKQHGEMMLPKLQKYKI